MKKSLLSIIFFGVIFIANCQNFTLINDKRPQESSINIISENENEITLKLSVNAYKLSEVETPNGIEMVVTSPN
ncbi:MAG: hypothetical protein HUK15_07640, partial [Bacteroidales bacterium]|nr:hypothetical protein [Bacteroidales bacterium]